MYRLIFDQPSSIFDHRSSVIDLRSNCNTVDAQCRSHSTMLLLGRNRQRALRGDGPIRDVLMSKKELIRMRG